MAITHPRPARPGASIREHLFSQFGHPRGTLGRLAGRVMAWENARANALVVELLGVGADDAVLDVGSGPGVAVAAALARAPRGFVAGVDDAPVMVGQARRRNRAAIRAGRAAVELGDAAALPFPAGRFTRALAVNAIRHWDDVPAGVRELHRVLRPGGRVVIALRAQRDAGARDPHAHGAGEADVQALTALLRDGGFDAVERRTHDLGRETLVTLLAHRPGAPSRAG
jgi:ubiquinone/menaquinone biosynthesis C-methylase UbiE